MTPGRTALAALFLFTATAAAAADAGRTLLGVELGTPFRFPPCTRSEETATQRLCYAAAQTTKTAWGGEEHHVFFPSQPPVPYARGEMVIVVIGGNIEAIHVNTWGIEAQGPAMDMLGRKYGVPTRERREKMKSSRTRLPVQYAEWERPDYGVKFDGVTSTFDWGRITLASARYRKLAGTAPAVNSK